MAFSNTIDHRISLGNKLATAGTFDCASVSGGNLNTGLTKCEFIVLQVGGGTVATNAPVVNETLPVAGSAVTIVTDSDATGYWFAIGY